MFLPSDFYSSSLSCSFLSVSLSLLLSGDEWMQELSTTFQSFPPRWKQIPLSSSDISIAWVESGKPLKNQFISTNHPKNWKLFEDYPKPQGLPFSPHSLRLFSPKQLSLPPRLFSFTWALQQRKTYSFLCFIFISRRNPGTLMFVLNTTSCALPWREAILVKPQNRQDFIFQPPPQKPDQNI